MLLGTLGWAETLEALRLVAADDINICFLWLDPKMSFFLIASLKLELVFSSMFDAHFWTSGSGSGCHCLHAMDPGQSCTCSCDFGGGIHTVLFTLGCFPEIQLKERQGSREM